MAFRLTTLFYLTALVASALAAFGMGGLLALPLIGAVPVGRWYCRNLRYAEGAMTLLWFVIGLLAVGLAGLVYLVGESAWEPVDRYYSEARASEEKLIHLGLGLEDWQQPETLSPQSWRTHVLANASIYGSYVNTDYRFHEPWDSPHNRQVRHSNLVRDVFQRASRRRGAQTHYVAIVDPRCAWRAEGLLANEEITDGPQNTLLLIETTSLDIAWNEPRDLTFDEAVTLLTSAPTPESGDWHVAEGGTFYRDRKYRKVLTCDGQVIDIKIPIDRQNAIALLTASGGEGIDWAEIDMRRSQQLDYARIAAMGIFVGLALMPIHPAAWRRIMPRALSTENKSQSDDSGIS